MAARAGPAHRVGTVYALGELAMIVITLISLGLAFAIIVGLAFSLDRVGIASTGPGTIGIAFIASNLPERAPGVQEDDLPRFVFQDRPWTPPAGASTPTAPIGQPAKLAPC